MCALSGSGTDLDLTIRNTSGAERVRYAWGDGTTTPTTYHRVDVRHSGKCLDVVGASTADGAELVQYTCGTGTNQQWPRTTV
ncbi:RICIN domain-containing protein [Saccharothrix longispora]|uniref:Ricin B lectin domain-containing protein n=1 Tax=Saccharothrix longispora TaxID=33920 RepID=A0ABU1PWP8_9PSEU|nr:RICIN domain-containing protein [Saccharothrix longispora]MDR6594314.1 hypothetical protein [Saccharothrix longispora]